MLNTLYYVHNSTLFNSKIVFEAEVDANRELLRFKHLLETPFHEVKVNSVRFTLWKVNEARPGDVYARPKQILYVDPVNPKPVLEALVRELEIDNDVDRFHIDDLRATLDSRKLILIRANLTLGTDARAEQTLNNLLDRDQIVWQLKSMKEAATERREERTQLLHLLRGNFTLTAAANQEVPQL